MAFSPASLTRGELQGALAYQLLSKTPDPLLKAELVRLASERRIWVPTTPAEAAGLLFRGVAPDQRHVERF